MVKLKVLIIEDNPGDFILIQDLLEEVIPQAEIIQAENFKRASQVLETNHFDIILLDLTLPDCSGSELVNRIIHLAANTPILVLTGYADEKFGVETLSMGVSDYIQKDDLNSHQLKKSVLYNIERTKISNKLRESEEKYKAIFHSSPLPMWVYDKKTFNFLDVNEAAIRHYGFSQEEFLTMNFKDLIPENASGSIDEILEICNNAIGFLQIVCNHITKEKEVIQVELQSTEIEFEKKKSRLVLAHDITQKTRAEEALKISERRFKALVQKGSDVFSILDTEGNYRYVGNNSTAILGVTPDEFNNRSMFNFIHPADVGFVKEAFFNVAVDKSVQIQPYRFLCSKEHFIWLETIITNMVNDVSVAGIVANSKNITEKIENDLKLKTSNDRFNIVSKATSDIIWDRDLIQNSITWNSGLHSTFGYPEETRETSVDWWYDNIHPDDLTRVRSSIRHHIENKIPLWQDEYRFKCFNKSYKYIRDRGFLVFDEANVPQRFIGAMQDNTQHKIEEHRLKLLESIVTNSTDAVILFAFEYQLFEGKAVFDGKITYVNEAFTKISGIDSADAIGNSISILNTLKISKKNMISSLKALKNFESFGFELSYSNKMGEEYFLALSMTPVTDNSQKLTHWAAIVSDITERTKKEHEITKAILGAQEFERYQIGCELHDNINQILSATQLALGMTKDSGLEDTQHWISQAGSYIDLAIDEIRRLSHRLAPNSLDGTSFHEAVNSLVQSLNVNNRIHFTLVIDSTHFKNVDPEVQINLYRIIQEQLNNIIKHSRAKNVIIQTRLIDGVLTLKIKDDGVGFNIYTVKKGIGLNNIVKRCDIINARLSLLSEINEGCEIAIQLNI